MTIEIDSNALTANANKIGWTQLANTNLLILVGVTGVGKTTTVNALRAGGLSYALLPNRRTLTDEFIIGYLQTQDGQTPNLVQDRAVRFDYTRRYRAQFVGGMAHALAQLSIDPNALTADWLIFDGLRGANEVTHAAALLPNARFLMLDAPDVVRVQRLLNRNDAFDTISGSQATIDLSAYNSLFGIDGVQILTALVDSGEVDLDQLKSKIAIVQKERENYDPAGTKEALLTDAKERTIYIDTSVKTAAQAAEFALERLTR